MTLSMIFLWRMGFDFKLGSIIMCWIIKNFEYYFVMGPTEIKELKIQL